MARGIDHLIIAVRDLEAARRTFEGLGFTVAPIARHPFGTANAVIQFAGSYLELVSVYDPQLIPAVRPGVLSFAAFNRDFLAKREGMSMLALKSADAAADQADFEAHGLPGFEPLHFERMATGPDGVDRPVSFSVTFTREPRLKEVGFLTCQHHRPENFWRQEYQCHANGALGVGSAVLVARDPADFHAFMTVFSGMRDMSSTSLGVTFDVGDGAIELLSPVGFEAWFGENTDPDPRRFLACRIEVPGLGKTREVLLKNGVAFSERQGALVVPPQAAHGLAIAFVARQ
jgi:catechol 2,3-dioxygenase-like lactoylglutathione lyase family enzyme